MITKRTITPEELKTILDSHNLWLETKDTENVQGQKADLSEADLHRANLREANLREADLSEADLYSVDITGANLSGVITTTEE